MRATSPTLALIAAGGLTALLEVGCDALSYYPYDCAELSECPGNACPGKCVPLPPFGFDGPALLWIGPETQVPECPARAPVEVYEGRAGLDASHECPPCECSQPVCELPSGITASTLNACPNDGPGATLTDFAPPPSWDGSCTSPATVPPNLLGSMTVQDVTERPCEPVPQTVPHGTSPFSWGVFARVCRGEAIDTVCGDPGKTCLPSAEPPPSGFRQCIMHQVPDDGTGVQCPEDYPDKHVFFGEMQDTRACTECTCTQTATSTCVAQMSVFEDSNCATSLLSTQVFMGAGICIDTPPGIVLQSMEASWLTNQPGACAPSGGTSIGEVIPRDPRVFCCQPPPGSDG